MPGVHVMSGDTTPPPALPVFTSPIEGAIYLRQRGFFVLPLHPFSKVPSLPEWPEWSLGCTVERLEKLGADCDWNWGVHPGASGHFVLDVDCGEKRGAKGKGLESLQALVDRHGALPKTFTVATPSGGLHLYFKGKVANTTGQAGPNLDSKCENGQVVAPGSRLDSGEYRIADDREPAEGPTWLIELLQPRPAPVLDRPIITHIDNPEEVDRALAYLRNAPPCVESDGGAVIGLYRVFCELRDYGLSPQKARSLVLEHYNPRCVPPWNMEDEADRTHLNQKLHNAYTYAQNSPGAKTIEAANAAAREDFDVIPNPAPPAPPAAQNGVHPLPLLRASSIVATAIPRRDWIIRGFLLGSFLSITGAPGGTGKSNFEILKAISIVTGRSLLGEGYEVVKRGPVVLYNCEDPLDEMIRRVEAFREDNGLLPDDLADLHLVSGREHSLAVAGVNRAGEVVVNERAVKTLIATVRSVGAVLLSADPMVRTHWLNENDNMAMDKVTQAFQRVSTETGCAVSLVHHTNKAAMRVDSSDSSSQAGFRGAGSLVASARVGHLLTTMGPEEAKKLGVPAEKRKWFFKVENAKANLSPPAETADWFEAAGVAIGNGEVIGVCRRARVNSLTAREEREREGEERTLAWLREIFSGEGMERMGYAELVQRSVGHDLDWLREASAERRAGALHRALRNTEFIGVLGKDARHFYIERANWLD